MPFLAACPYCPAKFKVPDSSAGASMCCPRCANFFTVFDSDDSASKMPGWLAQQKGAAAPPPDGRDAGVGAGQLAALATTVEPTGRGAAPASAAVKIMATNSAAPPATPPTWINTWGAVAFALGGFGLLFASFAALRFLTIPMSIGGLLVCLLGTLAAPGAQKKGDQAWLACSAVLSGAVLLVALFFPGWLNKDWASRPVASTAGAGPQLRMSKDNATVLGELTELDWTDASQEAIRHHALVCIESVALEPRADAGAGATDLELVIRVQLSNVERRSTIAYDGQQRIAHLPVLRDDRGVNLGRRERPSDRDGLIGKRYLMFRERVTDVFVFDAPAAGNGYLELELPAASWGSAGSCKFKIPTTMINKKTPTKRGDR